MRTVLAIMLVLCWPAMTVASEPAAPSVPSTLTAEAGAWFLSFHGTATADGWGPTSTNGTIDLGRAIGIVRGDVAPTLRVTWRPFGRTRLMLDGMHGVLSGQRTAPILASRIEVQDVNANIRFSVYHAPQVEIGFGGGVHIIVVDASFWDPTTGTVQGFVPIPIPVVGGDVIGKLSDHWSAEAELSGFYLDIAGDHVGVFDARGLLRYRWSPNVTATLGYRDLEMRARITNVELNLALRGPVVMLGVGF